MKEERKRNAKRRVLWITKKENAIKMLKEKKLQLRLLRCNILPVSQNRQLSCKFLHFLKSIMHNFSRWCVILSDCCKNLSGSCKLSVDNRLGKLICFNLPESEIKVLQDSSETNSVLSNFISQD